MRRIEKLIEVGSEPSADIPEFQSPLLELYELGPELFEMLRIKNGFYAFESALHVFPLSSVNTMSLEEWNAPSLWRGGYQDMAEGLLFFAEDVFQDQFCLSRGAVLRFKAETGDAAVLAGSVEAWADLILREYSKETGWALASEWQANHGPLAPGKRLIPKIPFFLGGQYSIDNLWAGDAVEGMRFKADLALQARNLPNGSAVKLNLTRRPYKQ